MYDELTRTKEENAHLKEALHSRTVIGQATGLLMATLRMSPDDAFAELVRMSSHANRKVRDIAAEVVAAAIDSSARDRLHPAELPRSLFSPSGLAPQDAKPHLHVAGAPVRSDEDPEA